MLTLSDNAARPPWDLPQGIKQERLLLPPALPANPSPEPPSTQNPMRHRWVRTLPNAAPWQEYQKPINHSSFGGSAVPSGLDLFPPASDPCSRVRVGVDDFLSESNQISGNLLTFPSSDSVTPCLISGLRGGGGEKRS